VCPLLHQASLVDDVDEHFERAKAAGAEITEEPTDQEYGERRYIAVDLEGHQWYFAQPTREVAPRSGERRWPRARTSPSGCPATWR
jgi:uncharacterized glyoxalase superfamily protein PhnB